MSFKEIKELRQAGKLDEALQMANQALEADSVNIWNKRNAGWVHYEYLKKYASIEHYDSFKKHLLMIKDLNLPEGEDMMFNQCAWQIGSLVFALQKQEPLDYGKINEVYDIIKHFHFKKPSEPYSFIYKSFHGGHQNWSKYLEFADWWDFANFRSEDFLEEEYKGRRNMSTVEKAYIAYSKKLYEGEPIDATGQNWGINKPKIEQFMPKLEKVVDDYPGYQYPAYYMAKLLLVLGDKENGLSAFLPFAKEKRNNFWVWQLMSEIFEDEEIKFACYCKALNLKTREDFLVKMRQEFAAILIDKKLFDEAKTEINIVVETRTKNEWKIPGQISHWMEQDWYKGAKSKLNNQKLYSEHLNKADEILFQDTPEEIVVVEYVNVHKSMLNFVKDKNKHGFFNYSNQLDKPQIGDILRVRFRGDGDNGFFKVLTAKQAEPNTPTDAIKNIEGVIKVIPPRNFGFVEDVFVDPQLIINHNLKDSESVECKALLSYNKKKKEWGWKAIEINSFINQKTTEEKWEMIKGSNFYFSDKEVSFITKAVIIQINADDGSTYKKLKVFSKLYQGGSSCFNIDKYTSKRFDHNDLINPACIISYQMKNTKTGEIIDRIRIADEPYKEIESK